MAEAFVQSIGNYAFAVEIKGVVQAHFASVTGLSSENECFDFQEGGVNEYTHKRMGVAKQAPLMLKRGIAKGDIDFFKWRQTIREGKPVRHDGSVIMFDNKGQEVCRWNFVRAWPSKYEGPELNGTANDMAIESLELQHEGLSVG
ncbi:MAG TPA: phage tail protein [Myxococcota bacterium]|jgi:phage tail-like protein|nr:phage tail protein [Myxococcota bacterium]